MSNPLSQLPWNRTPTPLDMTLEYAFLEAYAREEHLVLSDDEAATVQRAYSLPVPEFTVQTAECIMKRYKEREKVLFNQFMKKGFQRRVSTPTPLREVQSAESLPSPSILKESATPKPSLVPLRYSPTARKTDGAALRRLLTLPINDTLSKFPDKAP